MEETLIRALKKVEESRVEQDSVRPKYEEAERPQAVPPSPPPQAVPDYEDTPEYGPDYEPRPALRGRAGSLLDDVPRGPP